MKSTVSAIALASAIFATPAFSADLKGDPTSADYIAPDRVNWTGLYIGARLGYGNANHDLTVERYNGSYCYDQGGDAVNAYDPTDPTNPFGDAPGNTHIDNLTALGDCAFEDGTDLGVSNGSYPIHNEGGNNDHALVGASDREVAGIDGLNSHGIIGGGQIGGDYQAGRFVFGVFGSYDFSQMETTGDILSISNPDGVGFDVTSIEKGDEWSVGARAGLLVNPKTLVYLLAAYTQTDYDFKGTDAAGDAFTKNTTFDGVSVGGGIEFAMTQNVFLGLEYAHTFYGKETVLDTGGSEVGGFGERVVDDLDEDKVMATLKVKLNGGLLGIGN